MARGNVVDLVNEEIKGDLIILTPFFKTQDFQQYDEIKFSKNGILWGYWGNKIGSNYKDFLYRAYNYKLLRRNKKSLVLKKI